MLGALLAGCPTRVEATVASAPSACADGGASQRLAGAKVSVLCPQIIKGDAPYEIGRTNEQGELEFKEPALGRWIHDGCDVIIEKDGYRAKHVRVDDTCVERWTTRCVRAVMTADLEPLSAPRCP